jgi:hypothetical protein
MANLRLFPKHTGIWEGSYMRIDAQGKIINQWKSRLTIKLEGSDYHQVNHYIWDDGHEEIHDFGISKFDENGTLIFDSPRIEGYSWETRDSVCLVWSYKNRPGSKLFEMIDLIGDGTHRIRNWRWSEGDEFQGITMIEERKIATQEEIPASFWEELPNKRFKGVSRSDT